MREIGNEGLLTQTLKVFFRQFSTYHRSIFCHGAICQNQKMRLDI